MSKRRVAPPTIEIGAESSLPRFVKRRGKTENEICKRIIQAIFEHRIPPGERLTEEFLAETFEVSRTIVRQAVARLSQDGIFVKLPNIGTTVASPTNQQTKDMLCVRRMVEPEIVKSLAGSVTMAGLNQLREHLRAELQARKNNQRGTLLRLTGEFHLLLAELSRNDVLVQLMTRLQVLTCLAVFVRAKDEEACLPDEHSRITEAIAKRDGETAAMEMIRHLDHVEKDLELDRVEENSSLLRTMVWLRGR